MEPHSLWHALPWSLDICSTQRSPVLRVQMHVATNRDTHLCPPHISSVYLTTTYVLRSGRITNGMRSGRNNPTKLLIFIPNTGTGTHTHRIDPPKKSLGPAQPPPHRCRTSPLLLVQMRYGLVCGLWVWRRRTNRRPCVLQCQIHQPAHTDCIASRFWTMRQLNGCSKSAPRSSAPKQRFKQLAQKKEMVQLLLVDVERAQLSLFLLLVAFFMLNKPLKVV